MPHVHDYPQWLNLSPVTANGATFVQSETQLNPPSQQHVLEVCKVQTRSPQILNLLGGPAATGADLETKIITQVTRTSQVGQLALQSPDMIHLEEKETQSGAFEATESGGSITVSESVKIYDYTVGGLGFLVAAQSLFHAVDTSGGLAYAEVQQARILARWVKVDLAQLVEMVLQ